MTPRRQTDRDPQPAVNSAAGPLPATPAALLLPLATAAALSAWLLSRSFPPELGIAGLLLLLIVFSTLLFRSTLIPALLFLTQCVFAATERGSLRAPLTLREQIIAGCLLVLLMSLQRYLQLPEPPGLRQLLKQISVRLRLPAWLSLSRPSAATEKFAFQGSSHVSEFVLIGIRVVAAVVAATWLLNLIPNNLTAPDDVGLIPMAQRTIKLSLGLVVTIVLINAVLNSVAWRRLSPRAARLFLHSQLTEWCGSELRAILRLEEKQKRRRR